MATSLLSRKRDLAYFIHFAINLPMVLMIDLQSLYPPNLVPSFALALKNWYINTYHDDFFVHPAPWFKLFVILEAVFQVPVMAWALRGLWKDSPKIPLVLFPFAVKYFLTTLVCMWEYAHWDVPAQVKIDLSTLYGPYLAMSVFMGLDMYLRLSTIVSRDATATRKKVEIAGKKEL